MKSKLETWDMEIDEMKKDYESKVAKYDEKIKELMKEDASKEK